MAATLKVGDVVRVKDPESDFYNEVGLITKLGQNHLEGLVSLNVCETGWWFDAFNVELVADGKPPKAIQVGGDHYTKMKIQPYTYITENNLGFAEGSIIKYVSRYRSKNGLEDLKKARHFIDLLIEGFDG